MFVLTEKEPPICFSITKAWLQETVPTMPHGISNLMPQTEI